MESPPPPLFEPGEQVRLRSRRDRVGSVAGQPRRIGGEYWYPVSFGPGDRSEQPETDLEAYTGKSDSVADILVGGQFAGREAFSKLITHLKLTISLRSQIYALDASRTTFYAYQFKPLLKLLDSRLQRLLIADEVGLGKTIETGIILTEMFQRFPMKRVLIVVPAHLRIKWQEELRRRFDLNFEFLDSGGAQEFLRRYAEEHDEAELRGIISLQAFRGLKLQERWDEVSPTFDLVVFDEAGRLRNSSTRSHQAAERLAEMSNGLLLLTATPVQTGDEDLLNLLKLVDPDEFATLDVFRERLRANEPILNAIRLVEAGRTAEAADVLGQAQNGPLGTRFSDNPLYADILERLERAVPADRRNLVELQRDMNSLNVLAQVLSRTRKRDAHEARTARRPRLWTVEPTADERLFYDAVTNLARSQYARRMSALGASFATIQAQRQVASCMVAMIDYALERATESRASESAELSDLEPSDLDSNHEDIDTSDDIWSKLGDPGEWRHRLAANDSKWRGLLKMLQDIESEERNAKVVVFAYFKKTLRYLEERLQQERIGCVRVDGDVPTTPDDPDNDERHKRIRRFCEDPSIRVLLSSEVGDEGIDLQFAHYLVNYDLPWNPMKVEQRIGRLDRLGQKSPFVTVVNISMRGTVEDRILQRLYARIRIFQQSIGDLEAILGEEVQKLERDLFARHLTSEEEERRIEQAAMVIERRKLELEQFERDSERLIGTDDFFIQEINRARSLGRYVSGPELVIYLRDFLAAHHRSCTVKDESDRIYDLRVTDELRQLVRNSIPGGDYGLRLFLSRSASGQLRFTTDPELAQEDRKLEFLTFHHPLIRAIKRYYDGHETELHPVSYIRVSSSDVPPGPYAWFLYVTEITGARPVKDIEVVAFPVGGEEALPPDPSEQLLARMITESLSVPPAQRVAAISQPLCTLADEILVSRLQGRFEERRRSNDALVSNRLASAREGFERNKRRTLDQIEMAKLRNRKETYIRGLETRLRNQDAAFREREREIEASRELGRSFRLCGAGVAEIRRG